MKTVCVFGLGYVGLPLARKAHEAGFKVYGADTSQQQLIRLQKTETFFIDLTPTSPNASVDIFIACVPTPTNSDKTPNLKFINQVLHTIGEALKKNSLVIIESTVFPGYCEGMGKQILEEASGLVAGRDFYLAHCPERINPGDQHWDVGNIPRVLGAIDKTSADKAAGFYSYITSGAITITHNMAEAEASKMVENSFRDINIAFVNELAKSFNGTDVDIYRVINAASTKPFGYMAFYPGLGVGGHCIPVDPHYLISSAKERGFDHKLLSLARKINDSMVDYIVEKISNYKLLKNLQSPKIGILGLTYKADVGDFRESQPLRLRDSLIHANYSVKTFDPYAQVDATSLDDVVEWADILIIAVAHKEFHSLEKNINKSRLMLVVDTANTLDKNLIRTADYMGVGE